MKNYYIFLFLLFQLSFYAQNDSIQVVKKSNISVVSADRMNVVYRGVPNPISVMVPTDKYFSVTAPGLENKGNGKFILKPGIENQVEILVRFKNEEGKYVVEKHVFRIKGLPVMAGTINGNNCVQCFIGISKKELENAIISTEMKDFLFFDLDSDFFKVNSFEVRFSESKVIEVEGNTFNKEVYSEIIKLNKGDVFEININSYGPPSDGLKRRVFPIKVILAD